jgi:leader peptidase (prepilin peptidase)/N-methyltransferase
MPWGSTSKPRCGQGRLPQLGKLSYYRAVEINALSSVFEQLLVGPFGRVSAFVWGALWGSFFNVVVVRLPTGESVVRPPSHCRRCGRTLRWYDNIPILSYVLLRGRCRGCGAGYSPRYALVEAGVALIALAVHHVYLAQAGGPFAVRLVQFTILSLFCGLLSAIALIDLDTMRIPNRITYPGIPVAVLLSLFMGHPGLWDGLLGALGGYLVIRLIADGYELIAGRQGMGYGDAKLLALIGGLLGWRVLLPTLFLAALQGSVIGIGLLVWSRRASRRAGPGPVDSERGASPAESGPGPGAPVTDSTGGSDNDLEGGGDGAAELIESATPLRYARIPFGPFLSLAAIELVLARGLMDRLFPFI